ncbi:hypothetical protein [Nocardia jinanensis]|uniref:Bacterial toxin 24 domain-containing protein n=1 Tax=Nocardia jinanensis TaxID=382504 RepID=A0A917VX51_9NOCA|nr:hypothetical protein [Nocardia jinanensis]GGL27941.1 hypothetical protein GCM10011588_48440 [Nocardia jinanensis]
MNFINVDPAVYYEAATIVNRAASAFFTAYDQHLQAMNGTGAMAGSAGPGKDWATSYDQQVRETNNLVTAMMLALDKYARVLNQAGYVYASSDHDPKSGTPAPQKPPDPPLAYASCAIPPPSAGGPGSGLVDDGLELAKKIGIDLPVPDGDTDKLNTAATVWNSLAHAQGATNLPVELGRAAVMFQQVTAPEVASIDEDLRAIKTAAEDLLATFADLAAACAAQKTAHDNMKQRLHDLLAQFADELKKQIAITLALAVAASVVSFGIGGSAVAAIRAGKAVDLVNDLVKALRGLVAAAGLRTVVAITRATGDTRAKIERIHDLIEAIEDTVEALDKPELWDPDHRPTGVPDDWVSRTADNGKGVVWQKPGADRNADSVRVMEPTNRYPNGYVRFYNSGGQPINLDGKPGPNSETHIAINPDGTYSLPKGWQE